MNRKNGKHLVFILSFFFLLVCITSVYSEVPILKLGVPNITNINAYSANYWDGLDSPLDLLLSMFDVVNWIDTDLNLNLQDIVNVDNISATCYQVGSPAQYICEDKVILDSEVTADTFIGRDFLVGYWPLNENADDISGNSNHGTCNGGVQNISGRIGKAFYFDGATDFITIADSASLDFNGNDDITISAWVKPDPSVSGRIFEQTDEILFLISSSDANFILQDFTSNDRATATMTFNAYQWYHIVGTYENGGDIAIYVDGLLKDSNTPTGSYGDASGNMFIGKDSPGTNKYEGTIDEVVIWNRSLSANEIKQLYLKGESQYDNENTIYATHENWTLLGNADIQGSATVWEQSTFHQNATFREGIILQNQTTSCAGDCTRGELDFNSTGGCICVSTNTWKPFDFT